MANLTVSAVRSRVAAVVEAITGWHESRWLWDVLPLAEPSQFARLAFAVGVAETIMPAIESSRITRGADGARVLTTVVIRWLYPIRADGAVTDYGAMLDAEQDLVTAVMGTTRTDLHLRVTSMRRTTVGDGAWSINDVTLTADHRIAIQ